MAESNITSNLAVSFDTRGEDIYPASALPSVFPQSKITAIATGSPSSYPYTYATIYTLVFANGSRGVQLCVGAAAGLVQMRVVRSSAWTEWKTVNFS